MTSRSAASSYERYRSAASSSRPMWRRSPFTSWRTRRSPARRTISTVANSSSPVSYRTLRFFVGIVSVLSPQGPDVAYCVRRLGGPIVTRTGFHDADCLNFRSSKTRCTVPDLRIRAKATRLSSIILPSLSAWNKGKFSQRNLRSPVVMKTATPIGTQRRIWKPPVTSTSRIRLFVLITFGSSAIPATGCSISRVTRFDCYRERKTKEQNHNQTHLIDSKSTRSAELHSPSKPRPRQGPRVAWKGPGQRRSL